MAFLPGIFGKSAPKVTDPNEAIRREDLTNRANIISEFGGRTVGRDASGRSTVTLDESPFQKTLRELQERKALGIFAPGGGDFGRQATEKALFERTSTLLDPGREKARRDLETSLSLKGLPIGSEGFRAETERLGRGQAESRRLQGLEAVLAGGAESRSERASQLGSVKEVLGGTKFLQSLTNLPSINVADIFQRSDQLKLDRNQQENNRRQQRLDTISSMFSGAGSAAGTALQASQSSTIAAGGAVSGGAAGGAAALAAFSDERLKKDIIRIGKIVNGIEIVEFNYNKKSGLDTSKRYRGVIAQEVEKIIPSAVIEENGFKKVDYSKIGIKMEEI